MRKVVTKRRNEYIFMMSERFGKIESEIVSPLRGNSLVRRAKALAVLYWRVQRCENLPEIAS